MSIIEDPEESYTKTVFSKEVGYAKNQRVRVDLRTSDYRDPIVRVSVDWRMMPNFEFKSLFTIDPTEARIMAEALNDAAEVTEKELENATRSRREKAERHFKAQSK